MAKKKTEDFEVDMMTEVNGEEKKEVLNASEELHEETTVEEGTATAPDAVEPPSKKKRNTKSIDATGQKQKQKIYSIKLIQLIFNLLFHHLFFLRSILEGRINLYSLHIDFRHSNENTAIHIRFFLLFDTYNFNKRFNCLFCPNGQ